MGFYEDDRIRAKNAAFNKNAEIFTLVLQNGTDIVQVIDALKGIGLTVDTQDEGKAVIVKR